MTDRPHKSFSLSLGFLSSVESGKKCSGTFKCQVSKLVYKCCVLEYNLRNRYFSNVLLINVVIIMNTSKNDYLIDCKTVKRVLKYSLDNVSWILLILRYR